MKNPLRRGTARHAPRAAEELAARFPYSGSYTDASDMLRLKLSQSIPKSSKLADGQEEFSRAWNKVKSIEIFKKMSKNDAPEKRNHATDETTQSPNLKPENPVISQPLQTSTKVKVISELDAFITNAKNNVSSRYFFFLKTHKTASSTIQNVMLRYADFHKLNLAIPTFPSDPARFHYPMRAYLENQSIQPEDVYPRKNELTGGNNILCHHTRFSKHIYDFLYTEDKIKSAPE